MPHRTGRRCRLKERADGPLDPNLLAELVFNAPFWGPPALTTDDDRQRAWRRWGATIIADMQRDYPESIALAIDRLGDPTIR